MKIRACKPEFLEQAKGLDDATAEVLLSRMRAKLFNRLEQENISREEILGIQLEIEEDQLREWRAKVALIRAEIGESERRQQKKAATKKVGAKHLQAKKTIAKDSTNKDGTKENSAEKLPVNKVSRKVGKKQQAQT